MKINFKLAKVFFYYVQKKAAIEALKLKQCDEIENEVFEQKAKKEYSMNMSSVSELLSECAIITLVIESDSQHTATQAIEQQ